MASIFLVNPKTTGGAFLLESRRAEEVFAPEDFSPEHQAIAKAVAAFTAGELSPHLPALHAGTRALGAEILRKSAKLGFTATLTPESNGGMELDLVSMLIVAQGVGVDGSYAAWHGAHACIGTLPLLLFGGASQKQQYLPRLAAADQIAAFCLSEAESGSDALSISTRADITATGHSYMLSGQKMWVTNGGFADLFTVFAKVDGKQFTAFLVERGWPGVTIGPEEKKMGLDGSSTTTVSFDRVEVPLENLLGDVGQGQEVAFRTLNLGRLHLGACTLGACREAMAASIRYARERKAFGKTIGEFGLIQQKLADMAIQTYVGESMLYRVAGCIDAHGDLASASEEFAVECSFVKIFASEALDAVVDESVQIHGGYGYHRESPVEQGYRDSRINRIFEGTNEINRLLIVGLLLRRIQRGRLLLATPKYAKGDPMANLKRAGLFLLDAAREKFGDDLLQQQEIAAGLADVFIGIYGMESAFLRARKSADTMEHFLEMSTVFARDTVREIDSIARTILAACSEGAELRQNLDRVRPLLDQESTNTIALRRSIAAHVLA